MQALSGMSGLFGSSLGVKAKENYYSQGGQGLLGQINQAVGTGQNLMNFGTQIAGMFGG
jgi:hypothetical protein